MDDTIRIDLLENLAEAETCAGMMASSEPWITLRRDYAAALKIITDPSREVYLAWAEAEVAGFTILWLEGAFVGYIQSVCVAPGFRGQGIGTQLIAHAEKRIFRKYPNVFICVSSFNPGARRLYERLGYELVGELTDFIIPGESEYLLRKSIAPLAGWP